MNNLSHLLVVKDKMLAKNSSLDDHTTEGKIYEISDVNAIGFWIINDKGEEIIPISTTLRFLGD